MPIEKVKIAEVGNVTDIAGKYGPQKKVNLKQSLEGGDRWISGFIDAKSFNPSDYEPGKVLELEVWQNGKFWNFKKVSQKTQEAAKSTGEVMDALRKIYAKLLDIERRLPEVSEEKKSLSVFDEQL